MQESAGTEGMASLGRVRWSILALLVCCGLFSWLRAREASELPLALAAAATPVAVVLAVGIIFSRQIALRTQAPRTRFSALLSTYLFCGALGAFGALLAFAGDHGSRGALFALGAAIFALGSPPGYGASR